MKRKTNRPAGKKTLPVWLHGIFAGILWASGALVTVAASWVCPQEMALFVLPAVFAVLTGLLLACPRFWAAWLWSLPAGAVTWVVLASENAMERLFDAAFPGYGAMSAGGGFAVMMVLAAYFFFGVFGPLIGLIVSALPRQFQMEPLEEAEVLEPLQEEQNTSPLHSRFVP